MCVWMYVCMCMCMCVCNCVCVYVSARVSACFVLSVYKFLSGDYVTMNPIREQAR